MASTYKTPGVYVEEITKFPPSVASVETAIPAFIGYTKKAERNGETLKNVPTSIKSFLEFEQYFGGPPPRDVIVRLNSGNQYVRTERRGTPYLLYDSMRLFYDNGGGVCYVVSVGNFTEAPSKGNDTTGILGGLKALEKYDEPTLIVSPDSVSLNTDLYDFQQQAIAQCNKLQDRFLICDLLKNDEDIAGQTFVERIAAFRNNVGINNLKYSAAYTPWLRTSIAAGLKFRDTVFALDDGSTPNAVSSLALFTSLTNSPALLQLIYDLSNSIAAVNLINSKILPGGGLVAAGITDLDAQLRKLLNDFLIIYNNPARPIADCTVPLQAIYSKIRDILHTIIKVIYDTLPVVVPALLAPSVSQSVEFKLKSDIDNAKEAIKALVSSLVTHHVEFKQKSPTNVDLLVVDPKLTDVLAFAGFTIATAPKDGRVQGLYRILASKTPTMAMFNTIGSNPANISAADTAGAVTAAIGLLTNLKTQLDVELNLVRGTLAAGALATALSTALDTKRNLPVTSNEVKVLLTILKAYVDEEVAIIGAALLAVDVLPAATGYPTDVASGMSQFLLDVKLTANAAAGLPGATKASVLLALVFNTPVKDYTLIASSATTVPGAAVLGQYNAILNSAISYESIFDQNLFQNFGLYKTLLTKAGQDLMILPPGAAVAGVYASVDANRGVWKAPANSSLASVLAPYFMISAQDQESLNIDTNSGKSINAIRAFTGRGTLVWGTRTLAGNDNEWRYVPVRRFFNYAEESIKKATEPFVFEPNDLNTWVRVKAMIENFLTLEWRRGSLAGAKPNDAFFVKVGLGETMTSLDILEGRMIIEIGMAVVRPAEFIILKFSHKMQES